MKDFLTKNWLKMLLLLVVAFLFWLTFRGCKPTDTSSIVKIDSLISVNKKINYSYDSLTLEYKKIKYNDSVTKASLFQKLLVTKKQLNKTERNVNNLIAIADSLKQSLDTLSYVENCDSLIIEVKAFMFSNEELQKQYNEVLTQFTLEQAYNDSLMKQKDKLYSELRIAADEVNKNYDAFKNQYWKAEKSRQLNKNLTRGLAAAVLILGITVLINK